MKIILDQAESFHGHLGPFLALGVRAGLLGLRELKIEKGDMQIRVSCTLEYKVPFSCMLDGIQITTKCTAGNTRLSWRESQRVTANFELENDGRKIEVEVKPEVLQELKNKLKKNRSDEFGRRLALDVVSRADDALFQITHK